MRVHCTNYRRCFSRYFSRCFAVTIFIGLLVACSNEGPPRENTLATTVPEALLLNALTLAGIPTGLYLSDSIAYVFTKADFEPGKLILFDISDVQAPVFLSTLNVPGTALHIIPAGQFEPAGTVLPALTSRLFIPALQEGVHIVDVSDAFQPVLITSIPVLTSSAIDIALTDTFRCIPEVEGLRVFSTPVGAGIIEGLFSAEAIIAVDNDDNFCYTIETTTAATVVPPRLRIINPGIAGAPAEVGSMELEGQEIVISEGFAYILSKNVGMHIIDVKTPSRPTRASFLAVADAAGTLNALALNAIGKRAYIISTFSISIVDISDPLFPVVIGNIELLDRPIAIAHNNGNLYITTFDLTNFNPPQLLIVDVSPF